MTKIVMTMIAVRLFFSFLHVLEHSIVFYGVLHDICSASHDKHSRPIHNDIALFIMFCLIPYDFI